MTAPVQLLGDHPLPEGLWLLKWIDCFSFDHGSQSAHVELQFEKLVATDEEHVGAMAPETVQAQLAGQSDASKEVRVHRVQAALIAFLFVGDVFEGSRAVARLPAAVREVRVHDPANLQVRDTSLAPPAGWRADAYRVLNPFEFGLPDWRQASQSRCLVFEWRGTQYVLPKVVVFRAFFGMHTRLIDAVLGGQWPRSASNLICTDHFASGLETAVDAETGAWKIVLQMGVPKWMAAPLAFYWFDDHARHVLAEVYRDRVDQNQHVRGASGRQWFANAEIPHPLGEDGLAMNVRGFPLRRYKRFSPMSPERFLVTAITGHAWTPGTQLIEYEWANSNARSDDHTVDLDASKPFYSGFRPPVIGSSEALAASGMEGDADESENQFSATGIEIWPTPELKKQIKDSSSSAPSAKPLPSTEPSPIVSAGGVTRRETPAARAAISQRVRDISQQFSFLFTALDELLHTGRITSYEVVDAPVARTEIRNGKACWSLGIGNEGGWTFIKDRKSGKEVPTGRPRAALVLRIELQEVVLILIEIEPSSPSSNFLTYVWRAAPTLDADVEAVLDRLVQTKGIIRREDRGSIIPAFLSGIRHGYEYKDADGSSDADVVEIDGGVKTPDARLATGLQAGSLHSGLLRASRVASDLEAVPSSGPTHDGTS